MASSEASRERSFAETRSPNHRQEEEMTSIGRIRLGMVGGGQGAFIGGVHRIAARIDGHFELVAGNLSSDSERGRTSALEAGIAADRAYGSVDEMIAREAARPDGIEVVAIVTP